MGTKVDIMIDKWELFTVSPQLTLTCSKLTIETVEKGVKYVQS